MVEGLKSALKFMARSALRLEAMRFLDSPVFVVACGRSGSTALCEGLGAHPRVLMAGEAPIIHKAGETAADVILPLREAVDSFVNVSTALGSDFGLAYRPGRASAKHSAWAAGRRLDCWGAKIFPDEKAAAGLLWLFPNARFIYLFRNGVDVVGSMGRFGSFSRLTFDERCRFWSDRAFRYDYLRSHHRSETVRFEDFLADNRGTFDRLLRHLGLPADDGPANYTSTTLVHPLDKPTTRASARQVLGRRATAWDGLSDRQRATFNSLCGEAMALLGYDMPSKLSEGFETKAAGQRQDEKQDVSSR